MEVVLQNQVLVVGVPKEVGLGHGLELIVEELVGVPIGKLHDRVFHVPYALEHLIRNYIFHYK